MTDESTIVDVADFRESSPAMGESDVFPALETAAEPLSPAGDGGVDGQDPSTGRFVRGNHLGRGNPLARQAGRLRTALYRTCTPDDLAEVLQALIAEAKGGDVMAARVLLERLLGPPVALDVATRIERLEVLLQERRP
jgi:hypothetical protein